MSYRTAEVNKALTKVYEGDQLVGQVRQGLDHKWYPELPAQRTRGAAVQAVMLAHEAVTEFERDVSGCG
jgi:hypothetical protein